MSNDEIWLPVPIQEFARTHEVSNLGRLRSVARIIERTNRWGTISPFAFSGRVLGASACSNGYRAVGFVHAGKRYLIHRLVLLAFDPRPDAGSLQVNHKNGVRADNRLVNLEWVTSSENHRHSYRELNRKTHALIKRVRLRRGDEVMEFPSQSHAARYLGVVPGSVASAAAHPHLCCGYVVEVI